MTKLVSRLILAAMLFPLAGLLFVLLMVTITGGSGPTFETVAEVWLIE